MNACGNLSTKSSAVEILVMCWSELTLGGLMLTMNEMWSLSKHILKAVGDLLIGIMLAEMNRGNSIGTNCHPECDESLPNYQLVAQL